MDGYRDCVDRIDELDLSSDRERTLEPLLPSSSTGSRAR
jgi:hypothetical protein